MEESVPVDHAQGEFADEHWPSSRTAPVAALVLTYEAPAALGRCLGSLAGQSIRPASVVVIDNASSCEVEGLVTGSQLTVEVQRMDSNLGPAGGHAAGLRRFLEGRAAWAWVMDDDCEPESECLANLLDEAARTDAQVVMTAMVDRQSRARVDTQGWCGVLIHRSVIETVGVPREELFWWAEDTEYLQWRIPRAGFPVVRCDDAVVAVSRRSSTATKPPWKYYYEARNQVFYRLTIQGDHGNDPARHLRARVRRYRAARALLRLSTRALLRERHGRATRVRMVWRGALDGLRGRLGRTVEPDRPDRPTEPES